MECQASVCCVDTPNARTKRITGTATPPPKHHFSAQPNHKPPSEPDQRQHHQPSTGPSHTPARLFTSKPSTSHPLHSSSGRDPHPPPKLSILPSFFLHIICSNAQSSPRLVQARVLFFPLSFPARLSFALAIFTIGEVGKGGKSWNCFD